MRTCLCPISTLSLVSGVRFQVSANIEFWHLIRNLTNLKSEPQNRRMSNVEGWVRFAQSFFYKIDRSTQKLTTGRIHYFDIRYSLFDIRFFKVSFWIRLATFQIVGWVEIRATIVGFRSSTQPTEIVSRA